MAATAVSRTRGLDAKITVYDRTLPTRGDWLFPRAPFSSANPGPLWRSVAFLDEAREKRTPVTFRTEGREEARAMEIVRDVLASPTPGWFVDAF